MDCSRREKKTRKTTTEGSVAVVNEPQRAAAREGGNQVVSDRTKMGNGAQLVLVVLCGFLPAFGSSQTIHKMTVRSDIRFRFATTEITCVMSNDKDSASELTFDFTLPKDAFIANFSMKIEGKDYPGNVKKKQEARQEYLAARRSGSSGGLVEQSARHSNKFDVSVNMAAGSNVTFTLIYQELLRRRFGSYEYMVYLDGKTLSKILDFNVEVFIQDRNPIRDVRTPEMRKEVITNAVEEDQNVLTQITSPSENMVQVVYSPTREQLLKRGGGWFVVQYDVDSDSAGELLVVDGYFVHFFVPPDNLPPLPLDIVFVLDMSGSMAGRKLDQLKDAMRIILDDLRETDRFNILLFDGSVEEWKQNLQEASESNVNHAQDYIKAIKYRGSTNLHLALMMGLKMLQGSREASRVPMIFFLTDGEATTGEQDPAKIVAEVSRKNEGVVNIYSLAFGAGADYKLLRQISAKNNGFARKIYEASDAADQVLGLYREISTIVMRSLTVSYHSTSNNDDGDDKVVVGVDNSTITICGLPSLFGKTDFVVAGRLQNADALKFAPEKAGGLKTVVSGLGAKQMINFVLEENDLASLTLGGENPFWAVPRDLSKITERAWAFLQIKQLLEQKTAAAEDKSLVEELDKKILDLSLKYHFVTPLTSMVVTRPEDGLKKDAKSVEASFTDDDDVPAARGGHVQAAHQFQQMLPQMSHSQISSVRSSPHYASYKGNPSRRMHMRRRYGGGNVAAGLPPPALGEAYVPPMPTFQAAVSTTQSNMGPVYPPRTTQIPSKSGKKRGRKGRKNKKGGKRKGKKDKKCIRNKRVFLQSVMVHGSQVPVACYELRAARSPVRNYTVFADHKAKFSVTAAMKRKFLLALHIQHQDSNVTVMVNSMGELTATPQQVNNSAHAPAAPGDGPVHITPDGQSVVLHHDPVTIAVNITKKTCKVSIISIDVEIESDDLSSAKRKYSGIAIRALKPPRSKDRKGKGKRKRIPKGCLANNVAADRASIIKGKFLMRYAV